MRLSNGEVLLRWPLAQHIITQGWYYNDGSLHQAIDLRTQIDNMYIRPVYAAEDGTVDQTQDWDGHTRTGMQSYGNMVRIRHADYKSKTLQTRYAHLSSYCVKYGQRVKEGEIIGYSGVTGNVFGAHLHFEVILNGKRTNPLVWLDNDFTTASGQVFTYRPGEHAVQQPEQAANGAQTAQNGTGTLQVITVGPVSQGDADAVFAGCQSRGLTEQIIIALIPAGLGLVGVMVTNYFNNKSLSDKVTHQLEVAQAVTDTKIEELTREVRAHNNFAQKIPVLEEKMSVANHRIEDLERHEENGGRI